MPSTDMTDLPRLSMNSVAMKFTYTKLRPVLAVMHGQPVSNRLVSSARHMSICESQYSVATAIYPHGLLGASSVTIIHDQHIVTYALTTDCLQSRQLPQLHTIPEHVSEFERSYYPYVHEIYRLKRRRSFRMGIQGLSLDILPNQEYLRQEYLENALRHSSFQRLRPQGHRRV